MILTKHIFRNILIPVLTIVLLPMPVEGNAYVHVAYSLFQQTDHTAIQQQIKAAFDDAYVNQNNQELNGVITKLEQNYSQTKASRLLYWQAYALYHNSLYYLHTSNEKAAKANLQKGLKIMESIQHKDIEDYTLLALLHGLSCHFLGFPKVIKGARSANNNLEKAEELDDDNIRLLYVEAYIDKYRPAAFGGGKKVVELIEKALSLPRHTTNSGPSWGRQECFELISDFYIKNDKPQDAKDYILEGLSEYPNSRKLKEHKEKLKM